MDCKNIVLVGLVTYCLSALVVLGGVSLGTELLRPPVADMLPNPDVGAAMSRFDGQNYLRILKQGYSYDPARSSSVAFFPGYPLVARFVQLATGLRPEAALLAVSNVALCTSFVLIVWLGHLKSTADEPDFGAWAGVIFGYWPPTVFFHMAYAESLLLLLVLLVLIGLHRGWSFWILAVIAGAATAVRPVGVAVSVAVIWSHLFTSGPLLGRIARSLALGAVACWGLLAFMAYQQSKFGDSLAFARTQSHWSFRSTDDVTLATKMAHLVALEPIRGIYDPESPRYWAKADYVSNPVFSLIFWNPLFFLLAALLLIIGRLKGWLTGAEAVLGAGLLGIPYLTRAHEMSMVSHARFAAMVVPSYIVLARIACRLPPPVIASICGLLAFATGYFAGLFAANYPML